MGTQTRHIGQQRVKGVKRVRRQPHNDPLNASSVVDNFQPDLPNSITRSSTQRGHFAMYQALEEDHESQTRENSLKLLQKTSQTSSDWQTTRAIRALHRTAVPSIWI